MNNPTLHGVNQESPTNTKITLEPAFPARVNSERAGRRQLGYDVW
jgi:hypothetical protein